jgi:uncharacterized membrane protein YwaF
MATRYRYQKPAFLGFNIHIFIFLIYILSICLFGWRCGKRVFFVFVAVFLSLVYNFWGCFFVYY